MFDKAQFEATIQELEAGTLALRGKLAEVGPATAAATGQWWVTPPMAEVLQWIGDKTVEIGTALLNWILDLLKGATAPIWMFLDAYRWMDIKGTANGVSTDLGTQNLVVDDTDWSGTGRDAYLAAAGAQVNAAGRVGSIASGTSLNLLACAGAGLAFYVALAAILAQLIAKVVAAIAAIGSGWFSWAGAALIVESVGVSSAAIWTAVGTLAAFLGAQATAMVTLHGDAVDPGSFPNGVWPKSNTHLYSDATVDDGDADWSLKGR
ncbi:hypothetical protein [Actinoplanes sp. NPDC049802]|uniref:hypothetical protein n=1 Tax=Actinoplanes sp. NPDC049802 TaxID=3154742 RepID=UPI00340C073D